MALKLPRSAPRGVGLFIEWQKYNVVLSLIASWGLGASAGVPTHISKPLNSAT
jgi:hypothetical protein